MRKALSVAVLALAFCSSTAAGIMHNPAPEPPTNVVQEPSTADEDTTGAVETLTDIALTLLASVMP